MSKNLDGLSTDVHPLSWSDGVAMVTAGIPFLHAAVAVGTS